MDQKSNDTKQKILEAAKKEFAQNGMEATSVRAITDAAGVNVSAIHYHFGTKEDVLKELLQDFAVRFSSLRSLLKTAKTAEEFKIRLEMYLQQIVEYGMNNHEYSTIFYREQVKVMREFFEVVAPSFLAMRQRLIEFFQEAMDLGIIRKRNPMILAQILFSSFKDEVFECDLKQSLKIPNIGDLEYREKWIEEFIDILCTSVKIEDEK